MLRIYEKGEDQGSYCFEMVVTYKPSGGTVSELAAWRGTLNPSPGATREDVRESLYRSLVDRFPGSANGVVTTFNLFRNEL